LKERDTDHTKLPHEKLTNREYEILCMLGSGKRLKDIATELSLSPKTISAHRSHILEKLNLKTTGELIRYAIEHRITQ
jgi:DNA-binding NarL/FixJ family response regulator